MEKPVNQARVTSEKRSRLRKTWGWGANTEVGRQERRSGKVMERKNQSEPRGKDQNVHQFPVARFSREVDQ